MTTTLPIHPRAPQTTSSQDEPSPLHRATTLLTHLQSQHETLTSELNAFHAHLTDSSSQSYTPLDSAFAEQSQIEPPTPTILPVEFRQFRSSVAAEGKALGRVGERIWTLRDDVKRKRRETAASQLEKGCDMAITNGHGTGSEGLNGSGIENANDNDNDDLEIDIGEDEDDYDPEIPLQTLHTLHSSNLPFYISLWTIAKQSCTGITALGKRFYWDNGGNTSSVSTSSKTVLKKYSSSGPNGDNADLKRKSQRGVLVDIVAGHGEEWVKVSTVTGSRLLFERAKSGWEMESSDEDTDSEADDANEGSENEEDEETIELVRLAEELAKASRANRVRYRYPKVRFVLPKIIEGEEDAVDEILARIRKTGASVECGGSFSVAVTNGDTTSSQPQEEVEREAKTENQDLNTIFARISPNPHLNFTETLNVDCTLLLALVSDLSHRRNITPSATHHRAIKRQIELEKTEPLLPRELYPAMQGKRLVCTMQAAKRMNEIVDLIGTAEEVGRRDLLFGRGSRFQNEDEGERSTLDEDEEEQRKERHSLLTKFQHLSSHAVPLNLNLPIQILDPTPTITTPPNPSSPPPNLKTRILTQRLPLSEINSSVFLYGWSSGLMTVTSNRTVAKQVETVVEEVVAEREGEGEDGFVGPMVWVCGTARSLIGKEKGRRE